jgi:aldehyde dehydrogenase (NAD+)
VRTTAASATVRRLADQGHLIGDSWRPSASDGVHRHRYAATGEVQAHVGLAGAADVDEAVATARAALPAWAALGPQGRCAILSTLADLLDGHRQEASDLAALDNGTPVSVLRPGRYTAAWIRHYAELAPTVTAEELSVAQGTAAVRLVPFGVVGVFPPWNGSMMGMGHKCWAALAAGNTVVVKPPELAPFGMLRFGELALEAGIPPGVVNIVVGGATAGTALAGHPGVDKLTFTGGARTARAVMAGAAANLTPLALELGGKSPTIVCADADLDTAATVVALAGTALLSGQGCALPTRTYVHGDVYDELVDRVLATLATLPVGDPLDPATMMGPVVTEAAMERILGVIERAAAEGATLLAGGGRLGGDLASGWFVAPTVFGDVDHDSDLARNEVFGPVQAMLRFTSEDEALAKANDSTYGLAAYVHTADPGRLARLVDGLEAGVIMANGLGELSPATPFGGVGQSGFGREGGRAGYEEMVQRITVLGAPRRVADAEGAP